MSHQLQPTGFSVEGMFNFLDSGVSAWHAAAAAAAMLEQAGYSRLEESQPWQLLPGGKYYTTRNGSAILAWRMPQRSLLRWHATASHGDSPAWRVKALAGGDSFFSKAEVEGYGSMIPASWLDRPLSVAGRLLVRTAAGIETRLVAPSQALLCIPHVCVHFDKELKTGKSYNPQVDMQPIFGEAGQDLAQLLAREAGVGLKQVISYDLMLCIAQKACRVGIQGEFFMSGHIDDLECAYTTLCGFLAARGEDPDCADVWCMFDNEEVGSSSRQGAQGTLMPDVMARIEAAMGADKEQSIRARTNSLLLSADNGHARHPNHPELSDPQKTVKMGGGVILKYNARQTYTTNGFTAAAFEEICRRAGVPVQHFANRADIRGGGTLGNLLGHQVGMPMVDVGLAQLSMHSAMETASCADAASMAKACEAYYNTRLSQPADGVWQLDA